MFSEIKEGDIVKIIIDNPFKGLYGEFVGICVPGDSEKYGWVEGSKWDGSLMIRVEVFGRILFIPCDERDIERITPKCYYCEENVSILKKEIKMLPIVICEDCEKEHKNFKTLFGE